jgi:hypothetical protein
VLDIDEDDELDEELDEEVEDEDEDGELEEVELTKDEELEEEDVVVEVVEVELALFNVSASPPATTMIMITTTIPIDAVLERAFKNLDLRDESIKPIMKIPIILRIYVIPAQGSGLAGFRPKIR